MSKVLGALMRNDFAISNFQYGVVMVVVAVVSVLGLSALGDLLELTYSVVITELEPIVSPAVADTGGTTQ